MDLTTLPHGKCFDLRKTIGERERRGILIAHRRTAHEQHIKCGEQTALMQ